MTEQEKTMQAVYDMRQSQIDYFHQKDKYRLAIAKQKEAIVDRILETYAKAGIVKPREKQKESTPSLFQ